MKRANPGSNIILKSQKGYDPNAPRLFKRLYICWAALRRGFLQGCRPVIGVDGCHLKGPHKGVLLTAVGVDANDCIYPFAYAVVEKENLKSWRWFLRLVQGDIGIVNCSAYTFISDKQKGLIPAIQEVLPGVQHRFCVIHLYNNFKRIHKGQQLKDMLWKAVTATTIPYFNMALEDLRKIDEEAYQWLHEKPEEHWSRCRFDTFPKCDLLVNNLCERFNSVILEPRSKPILTMLEEIRL